MSIYCVNEEGVSALNNSANQVSQAGENFMSLVDRIESAAGDNPEGLGPHSASLASAIEEIRNAIQSSTNAAEEVAAALRSLAGKYQEIIENDPFGSDTGNGFAVAGGAAKAVSKGIGNNSSPTASFSKISGEHTYEQDLKNSNPNYSEDSFEWSQNCQRCVSAYEARRRGYDVSAMPAEYGFDEMARVFPLEKGVFSPYEGASPENVSANSGTQMKMNVDDYMKSCGDGARAIVCVHWKGGDGHVFIAERVNGKTRYIDPQNGNTNADGYFLCAKGSDAWCCRVDNLPFTDRIKKCCRSNIVGGTES